MSPRFSIGSGVQYLFKKSSHTSSRTSVRIGRDVLSSFSFEKKFNLYGSKTPISPTFDSLSIIQNHPSSIYLGITQGLAIPPSLTHVYSDLDDHWAKGSIKALNQSGIFIQPGTRFSPDKAISYNTAIETITQSFSSWFRSDESYHINYSIDKLFFRILQSQIYSFLLILRRQQQPFARPLLHRPIALLPPIGRSPVP